MNRLNFRYDSVMMTESGYNVTGRNGTPFRYLQFVAQSVSPPQIVTVLGIGS